MNEKDKTTEKKVASTMVEETKNITDKVMARVQAMEQDGSIVLPDNYAVGNHLKSAYLVLQDTFTRDKKPVLEACTPVSIANALLDMVVKNLSVSKDQAYFIPRGEKLCLDVSYFGNIAIAKRHGLKRDPDASVIYKGDIFVYEIVKGKVNILKHEQKLENINLLNIVGAYAVGELADGTIKTVIKTMTQIKTAWSMGGSKGNSEAHAKFPDQMAMKTVINSLCKTINAASDDGYLYDETKDVYEDETMQEITHRRQDLIEEANNVVETPYEEIDAEKQEEQKPQIQDNPQPITGF